MSNQGAYGILRSVSRIVKVYPFLYAALLAACILCGMFCDEGLAAIIDTLFYVSPIVVLMLFRLSFALKLCNWHRAECAMPIIPAVIGYADSVIFDLEYYAALANFVSVLIIIAGSIVNAYNMFIKPKED